MPDIFSPMTAAAVAPAVEPLPGSLDRPWIVIPCYNEAGAIGATVGSLRALGYDRIVVVDDGSKDDSVAVARSAGARVLRHAINLGQGAALQTGISYARRRGAQLVCTFDADGQHDPTTIATMVAQIERGYDVVLSSRFIEHAGEVPWTRRLLLRGAVLFTRLHSRLPVSDAHNGLRVLGPRAIEVIEIQQPGMAHASEILAEIAHHRLRWTEVSTRIVYTDYSRAKGQRASNLFRILFELFYDGVTRRR
jgi:glycosyltransferase involved in cell wall biosynthesis